MLLACDGTLVDVLEAAFLDDILIIKLSQVQADGDAFADALLPLTNEAVAIRKVVLRGRSSGRNYVYAKSALALDRLPPDLRHELDTTERSIGELCLAYLSGTRKELLEVNFTAEADFELDFGERLTIASRTYRLCSENHPLMVIREYLPSSLDEAGETNP